MRKDLEQLHSLLALAQGLKNIGRTDISDKILKLIETIINNMEIS